MIGDKAVNGRESIFRRHLGEVFREPHYTVPDRGFSLRRADGTELTDIDAVLIDKQSGTLGLLQLKWPDIYGRSLAERNSRRANLLKANEWVQRVSDWIGSRSSRDVAAGLGISAASSLPPSILVVARHTARFSGEDGFDPRAAWVSWPSLARLATDFPERNIFEMLPSADQQHTATARPGASGPIVYQLPGLTVEIHSNSSRLSPERSS